MSVEAIPGGKRRIDRVLDPRFVAHVAGLGLDELRFRRGEAEAEERIISYLRRLLQGRLDILRAELVRRARGGDHDMTGLVAGLAVILSDPKPGSFAALPKTHLPEPSDHHRRRVDRLISDETLARLPEIEAEELAQAVEVLTREEESVSTNRRAVQQVVDLLRGELARRYRNGTASVVQLLE
ncbi:MAG TPA: aerial mycelium formation protein [Actinomycetes bacterium]|jgi:hypothetical protein|nr:aerial mycelium formation protein [Actinomycetes bacterium]